MQSYENYEDYHNGTYNATTWFPEYYPKFIDGNFFTIKSFGECPRQGIEITDFAIQTVKSADISAFALKSLKGISKKCFLQVDGKLTVQSSIEHSILSVLLIKKINCLEVRSISIDQPELIKMAIDASMIVSKHLQGERDILDCQEELITVGLKEYAKL